MFSYAWSDSNKQSFVKHIRKVTLDLVGQYRVGVEPVGYLVRERTTKKGTTQQRRHQGGKQTPHRDTTPLLPNM